MTVVEDRERSFLEALGQLDDGVLQYEYVLSFAAELELLSPEECTDENLLSGCTAQAWLELGFDGDGGIAMRATSDALVVRGLLGAVSEMIKGVPVEDIAAWNPCFMNETQAGRQLLSQRRRGLSSFVERIVQYASKSLDTMH